MIQTSEISHGSGVCSLECVLGLFVKRPGPGMVKTRLAAQSSPIWATKVAQAFLNDSLGRLGGFNAKRVLAYAPGDSGDYFRILAGDRFSLIPQVKGDLGQRMKAFFRRQFHEGAGRVVLLGTDSPTVPLEYIHTAFQKLEDADIVIGPATDGGYYLLGLAGQLPPIFTGIGWGGPTVLAETIARLKDPSWRLALLPPWFDVDTIEDWQNLQGHLLALRRAGFDPGAPHTQELAGAS